MGNGFWNALKGLRRRARKVGFPLWVGAACIAYQYGVQTEDWMAMFLVCWLPMGEVLLYL